MIGRTSLKYALRSLRRHPRRTLISMVGVGVGVGIGLFATSWIRGAYEMQVRAASESGVGHLRVVPLRWAEKRENSLRLADPEGTLAKVKTMPGVRFAVPRARASGLLAMGNRAAGVEIVGVVPEAERASNRIVGKSEIKGRYLAAGDRGKVVIGGALAKKLDVELDDDLQITLSGRGGIRSAMLTIVGLISTGSRELDESICHVTIEDLERITGRAGLGEITILISDYRRIDATKNALSDALAGVNEVLTWQRINPELAANAEGDRKFTAVLVGIIIVVVSLGIASAQLTAVLERRREFGVLLALGMKGRQIVAVLFIEGMVIGVGGALVALGAAAYPVWLIAVKGVSFAEEFGVTSFAGILFEPVIYGDAGLWMPVYALCLSVAATLVASVYPARFAMRTNPADALRVV